MPSASYLYRESFRTSELEQPPASYLLEKEFRILEFEEYGIMMSLSKYLIGEDLTVHAKRW